MWGGTLALRSRCLLIAALIIFCAFVWRGTAAQNALRVPSNSGRSRPLASRIAEPKITARAAIVIDARTGETLFSRNPDQLLPPASTTKIMTAFLLARDVPPDTMVTISPAASRTPGNSVKLPPGTVVTARDLLYAQLLASANNASNASAEQMAGSVPHFVKRMNDEAKQLGAKNTHFVNPSGLPASGHLTTARDLAAIARAALQNPIFDAAVRARSYQSNPVSGGTPITLTNKNDTLWTIPGADGVKTGATREAGFCFVGSATRKGRRLITVVLNSPNWRDETAALLDYGFAKSEKSNSKGDKLQGSGGSKALAIPGQNANSSAAGQGNTTGEIGTADAGSGNVGDGATPPAGGEQASGHQAGTQYRLPRIAGSPTVMNPQPIGTGSAGSSPGQPAVSSDPVENNSAGGGSNNISDDAAANDLPDGNGGPMPVVDGRKGSHSASSTPASDRPDGSIPRKSKVTGLARDSVPPVTELDRLMGKLKQISFSPTRIFRDPTSFIFWLLLLILLFLLLRKLTKYWKSKMRLRIPTLYRQQETTSETEAASSPKTADAHTGTAAFVHAMACVTRCTGQEWLTLMFETPHRLLEPAVRRQARALRAADPLAADADILGLLDSPNLRLRSVGAMLTGTYAPRRAEEVLLGLLEDSLAAADVKAEVARELIALSGDRLEKYWLQMLLCDGSPNATRALIALPRLDEKTIQALRHVLDAPAQPKDADDALRAGLRSAYIACVLGVHSVIDSGAVDARLNALAVGSREQVVTTVLSGVSTDWAIRHLVEIALHGHGFPAFEALLNADPTSIRAELDKHDNSADIAVRTRMRILRWLLLGEGDTETVQKLAGAGNDLAVAAVRLERLHRREPATVVPEALLAASQILSLRLGYSRFSLEQIAAAFRKSSTGGQSTDQIPAPLELAALASAYNHPDVYDAVQSALLTDEGLPLLLAELARHSDRPQVIEELAFWSSKMPSETRQLLMAPLCASDNETARRAVAGRATDTCPVIRSAALRSLRSRPIIAIPVEISLPGQEVAALDRAA